jgi:RNA polymerase sigma-70 factor (ECF subfamily)
MVFLTPFVSSRWKFLDSVPFQENGLFQSDAELVLRSRRGDRAAFGCLVERYERAALAAAKAILGCWHDARDAVQDAFVRAYQQINRLWVAAKFGGWFLRIVRREALVLRRRRVSRGRHLVAAGAEAAEVPAAGELAIDMTGLIGRLPEQECVVVSLRHLDEMAVAEIARVTGRPVGTVTKQLSRAYARMRGWLEGEV